MKSSILVIALCCFAIETIKAQTIESNGNPDKLFGVNLIKNPNAEKVTSSGMPIDWKSNSEDGDFVSTYGHTSGEWDYGCDTKCGLPENAGDYYFRAAADIVKGENDKSLEQTIDLTQLGDTPIKFSLAAQIAGFHCDGSSKCAFGYIKINFLDSKNHSLKVFEAKKYAPEFHRIDDSESGDSRMFKFGEISVSDSVPAHSVRALVTIGALQNCQEDAEIYCGAAYVFFDNLNLILFKS